MTDYVMFKNRRGKFGVSIMITKDSQGLETGNEGIFFDPEDENPEAPESEFRERDDDSVKKFWTKHVEYVTQTPTHTITYFRYCPGSNVAGHVFKGIVPVSNFGDALKELEKKINVNNIYANVQYPLFPSRTSKFRFEGVIVSAIDTNTSLAEHISAQIGEEVLPEHDTIVYYYTLLFSKGIYIGTKKIILCTSAVKYKKQDFSNMVVHVK